MQKDALFGMQKGEITEHLVYSKLAGKAKDKKNADVLARISKDELGHYKLLSKITGKEAQPDTLRVYWYDTLSSILGLSFGLRLMERGEAKAQDKYGALEKEYPGLTKVIADEERHEMAVLSMISEQRLEYASSVVLGLNDALVELTGTLAGLTLALADTKLIAITGLIMGVAAALSMSASSYLSAREDDDKNAKTAATYTGVAYILAVLLLVAPYFVFPNVYVALAAVLVITISLVAGYTFYVTTAKDKAFWPRFIEMAAICLVVTAISFGFGLLLKQFVGTA
jgi:VIT1/CCC1 family predicted Fe2+/Mn2+ transporter